MFGVPVARSEKAHVALSLGNEAPRSLKLRTGGGAWLLNSPLLSKHEIKSGFIKGPARKGLGVAGGGQGVKFWPLPVSPMFSDRAKSSKAPTIRPFFI